MSRGILLLVAKWLVRGLAASFVLIALSATVATMQASQPTEWFGVVVAACAGVFLSAAIASFLSEL